MEGFGAGIYFGFWVYLGQLVDGVGRWNGMGAGIMVLVQITLAQITVNTSQITVNIMVGC